QGLRRARLEVYLNLLDNDGESGFMGLHLSEDFPAGVLLDDAFLEPMRQILAGGQHTVRLIERVARVSRRAYRRNQELRRQLERYTLTEGVVAVSDAMRQILEQAELIAGHDTTVLLRGESGTGKELLARTVHRLSHRSEKPFLQVNCGALPEGLVESELFGHEKGAFTHATGRHIGRFERAQGGTILLDEVAELPLPTQVKLLRVLQERTFERVGGEHILKTDVRVIAATHQDLEAMVARGTFRADLYYRINVFPIVIPPLRERQEDIPALTEVLLDAIARRLGREPPEVAPETMARLCEAHWSGNVRELENILERAVILSPGDTLHLPSLPDPQPIATAGAGLLPTPSSPPSSSATVAAVRPATVVPLKTTVRRAIEAALSATRGKIYGANGAAELLALKPSTLQSKMKQLGIERSRFVH
ncbi:MAG: sigma 54-interacting transcriptional regulator, partial [Myxococcota bacterium]